MLSTPPAFILSQDQTLIKKFVNPMSEIILACIFPNHLYCYWFVGSLISSLIRRSWNSCLEFQGCHVVNFSRFFVFSPLSDNFYMLSHLKFFVNNFFIFFQDLFGCWCLTSSATTSKYYHTEVCMSTTFFSFSLSFNQDDKSLNQLFFVPVSTSKWHYTRYYPICQQLFS